MKSTISAFIFLLCIPCVGNSQVNDSVATPHMYYYKKTDFSLLMAYQQGRYGYADIGFALNTYGSNRHPFSMNLFVSNEIRVHQNTIIGPKIGVWVAGGFAMGLNLVYYTNFNQRCLVFRPEYGVGIDKIKFVYGYNFRLTKFMEGINRHQVGITYCLTLKRLRSSGNIPGKSN